MSEPITGTVVTSYEFRLHPTKLQEFALHDALRLSRELYNAGLQELIEHYEATGKHLNRYAHGAMHGKQRNPLLPAVLVDTTIYRLHNAYSHFFKRIKEGAKPSRPRFKSANRWHSLQFRDAVSNGIDGCFFKAGRKLGGRIRFIKHREIEGKLKFCRIVKRPSGWFFQAVCEIDKRPLPVTGSSIGLDFGITYLVADSEGNKVTNPQHLKKSLKRLARAQRIMARRKKGSNRRRKAAKAVARIHEHITNQRKDSHHKVARDYVNRYGTIVIEDLKPANMVKNRRLSRAISDSSWGMLRSFIFAKAASAGRSLIAVPPQYTSQICSGCGVSVKKSLSVRTHVCPDCGYVECRDVNAAKNILRLGLSLQGVAA